MPRPKVYPITATLYIQLREVENGGICLDCGHIHHDGCEPDAENYPCDNCGENGVMGIELALILGRITIDAAGAEPDDSTERHAGGMEY